MARLNKKILCFVDEYGTAGDPGFSLGCVMVWSRQCGQADKAFSDLLPASAHEVHASKASAGYVQGLLAGFAQTPPAGDMIMLNKKSDVHVGTRPQIYAKAVIETAKAGIKMFARQNHLKGKIGNVELIVDLNAQNTNGEFHDHLTAARTSDGIFRAVQHVAQIDSGASRILQLADVVAHSRAWVTKEEENAAGLREKFNIVLL